MFGKAVSELTGGGGGVTEGMLTAFHSDTTTTIESPSSSIPLIRIAIR